MSDPCIPLQIVRMLERINLYEVLPRKWVFVHTHDGVRAALAALDDGENGFSARLADSARDAAPAGIQDVSSQGAVKHLE